ncbi:MAG: hypothetical protein QNK23_04750 [Crocinitomicaceae bacterium]|nr:hypothetical protein [Crocinitomicaceae bacterium]
MSKKRLALITVWFPPNNGVAVNRMKSFAKYLGESYELEVFTLGETRKTEDQPFGKVHYFPSNSFLEKHKHTGSDSKVKHKLKSGMNILAMKLNVSKYSDWQKSALQKLQERHTIEAFDVLISSFSPVEAHEVAFQLKKNHPDIKWIADMRDEMSLNPLAIETVRKTLRKKEQRFANHITAVTTVSKPILDDFVKIFPNVKYFEEVRNGYDHTIEPESGFNEKFTMVYAGTFYGKIKPDLFLEQLSLLMKEGTIGDDISIRFVGTSKNFNLPIDLEKYAEFVAKVPYLKAVEIMKDADCNLLFCPPFDAMGRYTGKLFDYLSVEKPILAMIDKKDVGADLIEEHQGGFVADFYNEEEIREMLIKAYTLWKNKERLPISREKTNQLHRKHQVEKLKQLIEKISTS